MKEELTFKEYLFQYGHSVSTVKSYLYTVDNYLTSNPGAESYKYREVLKYIEGKVKEYNHSNSKNGLLAGIKKYYDYLIELGKREDHPCRTIYIKGRRGRDIIHHDLFTTGELELMMEREERYQELKLKNQLVISLLIYQGLTSGDIVAMKVRHVDLDKGTVYVKGQRRLSSRHIELHRTQHRIIDKYISEARPKLKRTETDALVLGKLGTPATTEDINYLTSTFKGLYPDRILNPKTIRQSVISNWLNEKKYPIEQVQLMAGHKWISTTDKYRQSDMDEQREMINKWFPI